MMSLSEPPAHPQPTAQPFVKCAPGLSGFVLINKPVGCTSHQVVSWVRRTLGLKRAGHSGTLDPFASGLLPVLVGPCTRLADSRPQDLKTYLFTLALGKSTDTLDPHGQITAEAPVPEDFQAKLQSVLNQFVGDILQIPPAYSALKVNGKALYEYMRGTGQLPIDIAEKQRVVTIASLNLISWEMGPSPTAQLRVACGKGTYIRSLARDLAVAIGTVGYCKDLCREAVGPWHIDDTTILSYTGAPEAPHRALSLFQEPHLFLPELQQIHLGPRWEAKLRSGSAIPEDALLAPTALKEGPAFVKAGSTQYWGQWEKRPHASLLFKPQKLVQGL